MLGDVRILLTSCCVFLWLGGCHQSEAEFPGTGEYDCDPLTNDGCDEGKYCYYDVANTKTDCSNAGTKIVGATCGNSKECRAQMVCISSQCHAFCEAGDSCNNGHNSCSEQAWPNDWGNCPLPPRCDPVTQLGCSGLASCYVLNISGELDCIFTSTGEIGDDCSTAAYCKPGLQCTSTTDGTCVQLCWVSADCESGECITQTMWTTGLGVCF